MRESGRGEYADLLQWAAYGERKGEALFAAMAEKVGDDRQRAALELLASLERVVAQRLQPLVAAHGGVDDLTVAQARAIADVATRLVESGWSAFLSAFGAQTARALERYARLCVLAPRPEPPELALLIAHEEALGEFARLELEGDFEGASRVILDVIRDAERAGPEGTRSRA